MKKEIADYKELIEDIDDDELRKFCVSIGAEGLMKMFQLSRLMAARELYLVPI